VEFVKESGDGLKARASMSQNESCERMKKSKKKRELKIYCVSRSFQKYEEIIR